ncbi:HdeA/HdeB family protein [Sulfitobacter marinus]|uniref:HdeA/HdeB family protein n=1 Tax=Sulfitobacter marinus TaxID=394264 RepID=A0A1I6T2G8_9RHOB|nr:HdeA/HdeB family chaperone [Sulfitobacter marinus]SFS83376.1 HdeA/HdeB family protein [Sulfitobacter marinus]
MKTTFKTIAIAALMGTMSAPAFAAAHADPNMTCADFNQLSADDQATVAAMAIAEVDDGYNGESMEDTAKATDSSTDVTARQATDGVSEEGSLLDGEAKAVAATGGNTAASNATAEAQVVTATEQLYRICDINLDATVGEAAAGLSGTK